ncbi:MAG: hypothetical protein PHI81_03065 [Synergistaceae bacterium]|jgi:hypothetical protein|uniref:hypothetical protein n=1 Tax=Aminivibrio sp. TaxID=1872489 RepID=UPI0016A0B5FC|nr:hypothetical protein [Synergistaceae bacterium]MDD3688999.1 hypothetical protein [Synergistaceae bacterium]MDD4021840.1 hypothetical protein [Synergistaceae bacterium]MDD4613651.1 hypothetical protein [Synergistaceae bacterium]NLO57907.1 hypothetical protein [Synergistaceae bacterium]
MSAEENPGKKKLQKKTKDTKKKRARRKNAEGNKIHHPFQEREKLNTANIFLEYLVIT